MTWSDTAVPTPWTTPSWTSLSPTPTPTPTEFYTSSPQDGVGGYDFSFTPGQALRRKVHFDYGKGFVVSNSTPRGNCPYRFCLHISFSSSYGTMSDFDAFVMDRYESKNDIGSDSFREDGPVPLVAGALNEAELQAMSKNSWTDGSRYNESRKTSWMLYPMSYDTDEIDIVMSFK
jgi:hypothetical protein